MKNFFELFSLPTDFAIDEVALEKKYLEFQKLFHPDNSSSDDVSRSIEINQAYKILADDFLRACHLLALQGIDLLNDEKAVKPEMVTLLEVLELQEKIEEISDKNEIETLRKKISIEVKQLIAQAIGAYKANDLKASAQFLVKAKYLKKSQDDLKLKQKNNITWHF